MAIALRYLVETLKKACSLGRSRVGGALRTSPLFPRGECRSVGIGSSVGGSLIENSRIQRVRPESDGLKLSTEGVFFKGVGGQETAQTQKRGERLRREGEGWGGGVILVIKTRRRVYNIQ